MVFKSIDELVAHVENCVSECMSDVAEEMQEIARRETDEQLMGWSGSTGSTVRCIQPTNTKNSAEIVWEDSGNWFSVYTGEHFYAPWGLENGTTWGRGASSFVEDSFNQIQSEIPTLFVRLMMMKGVPIK